MVDEGQMAQANGTVWKGATAVLGLLLTAAVVWGTANQDWGTQKQKLDTVAVTVEKHEIKIECHAQEIATLKANLANLLDRQKDMDGKLDELLRRMPPIRTTSDERPAANKG
jgi:Tfp pilus assembly protein PilO